MKGDDLSVLVVLRLELELHSSSLIDEAVLDETKAALNARKGAFFDKSFGSPLSLGKGISGRGES